MTTTPQQLVDREVYACASWLISTMAAGYGEIARSELADLVGQAAELCYSIPDYEEAAIQAGWTGPHEDEFGATYFADSSDGQTWACADWQALCADHDIEPCDREVFEHWIISDWLADKLEARGEKVDRDFANLTIWARTTTGQGIASDYVIEQICAALNKESADA